MPGSMGRDIVHSGPLAEVLARGEDFPFVVQDEESKGAPSPHHSSCKVVLGG